MSLHRQEVFGKVITGFEKYRPMSHISGIDVSKTLSGRSRPSLAFVIEPTNLYHEPLAQFLHSKGMTIYLVNPGRIRKFAGGIGTLSKNDVIDADLLARYGLMAEKLIVFEPAPQEIE